MVYQKKGGRLPTATGIAIGLAAGWLVMLALTAICALLLEMERLPVQYLSTAAVCIMMTACVTDCAVAAGRVGRRRMAVCLLSAGGYFLSLLGCNALIFGGRYRGVAAAALTVLGMALLTGLAGRRQKNGKFQRSARAYRR